MFRALVLFWTLWALSQGHAAKYREESSFVPQVSPESGEPNCAHGHTYCLNVESYPRETIVRLLKAAPDEITSFLIDTTSLNHKHGPQDVDSKDPDTFVNLLLNTSVNANKKKEEQLCQSVIRIIKPLVARNEKNDWRFIVNVEHSEQVLEIEYCKNEERKCRSDFTEETHAQCEQKMMLKRLLALDPSGKKLTWHNTMLPSCCQCTLYEVPRLL